jgi:hypothetical protein
MTSPATNRQFLLELVGFALLRFRADTIDVSYIDEYGELFFEERFEPRCCPGRNSKNSL